MFENMKAIFFQMIEIFVVKMLYRLDVLWVNSLWPSDSIWWRLIITGSINSLPPVWRQDITWTNEILSQKWTSVTSESEYKTFQRKYLIMCEKKGATFFKSQWVKLTANSWAGLSHARYAKPQWVKLGSMALEHSVVTHDQHPYIPR